MADPTISVVVPVRADPRLDRLLRSLDAQQLCSDVFEVIVVENGSTGLEEVARRHGARYLHLDHANPAAARNLGLSRARGSLVLMTDADCVARPDWVEGLASSLRSAGPRAGAVGGAIVKHAPATLTQRGGITVVDGQAGPNYLPASPLPYVVGANVAYSRAALLDVGGFDERFVSGSDVDVCYRLALAGHTVGLAPDAVVEHEDRADLRSHFHRFAHYAHFQVLLFAVHKDRRRRRWLVNPYPWRRLAHAAALGPRAVIGACRGDLAALEEMVATLVEACGVWAGDLTGSLAFRQLYL